MDQTDAGEHVSHLLSQDSATVHAWLVAVESGERTVPADFNWHGLAEVAAANALRANDLTWAWVATSVYDRLAHQAPQSESSGFAHSAMWLRAALIARLGPRAHDPVLDMTPVIGWVRAGLIMPPEEAMRRARAWNEGAPEQQPEQQPQQREQVRQLREMKNRLAVVGLLVGVLADELDDLQPWLEVRAGLP